MGSYCTGHFQLTATHEGNEYVVEMGKLHATMVDAYEKAGVEVPSGLMNALENPQSVVGTVNGLTVFHQGLDEQRAYLSEFVSNHLPDDYETIMGDFDSALNELKENYEPAREALGQALMSPDQVSQSVSSGLEVVEPAVPEGVCAPPIPGQ